MTRAVWEGEVLAESEDIVYVEGNAYFPRASLREELFDQSSHHTICPWKGLASYLDVVIDGRRNKEAAWYYPNPSFLARKLKGRIAFWKGVNIEDGGRPVR